MKIEESFEKIEEIIGKLEDSDTSLEDAFAAYKEGLKLVEACNSQLNEVSKELIVLSEQGQEEGSN